MRTILCLVVLLAACLLSGCSSGAKKVQGKIVKGGQPFTLSEKGVFVLSFLSTGSDAKTYNATTKPDGTFTVLGPENKGIPPGRYKVQLTAMDPYPTTDKLKGKFAPGAASAPTVDVGSGELVVDVGN